MRAVAWLAVALGLTVSASAFAEVDAGQGPDAEGPLPVALVELRAPPALRAPARIAQERIGQALSRSRSLNVLNQTFPANCTNDACWLQFAKDQSVRLVVGGSLERQGEEFVLSIWAFDAEHARRVGEQTLNGQRLESAVSNTALLVDQLLAELGLAPVQANEPPGLAFDIAYAGFGVAAGGLGVTLLAVGGAAVGAGLGFLAPASSSDLRTAGLVVLGVACAAGLVGLAMALAGAAFASVALIVKFE